MNTSFMEKPMKHIVLVFATVGVLIPILLIITFYLESYFSPMEAPISDFLRHNLWPSNIFLMATDLPGATFWLRDPLIWTVSILLNVVLYAFIGLAVASACKLVLRIRSQG